MWTDHSTTLELTDMTPRETGFSRSRSGNVLILGWMNCWLNDDHPMSTGHFHLWPFPFIGATRMASSRAIVCYDELDCGDMGNDSSVGLGYNVVIGKILIHRSESFVLCVGTYKNLVSGHGHTRKSNVSTTCKPEPPATCFCTVVEDWTAGNPSIEIPN